MTLAVVTSEAQVAWKYLNGLFCIYKPIDIHVRAIRSAVITKVCHTLNELKVRPPNNYIAIEPSSSHDQYNVTVRPDYSDHPLAVGPRYQPEDIRLSWATSLGAKCSGLVVMGINQGASKALNFHKARPLRTYHLKGLLGQASDNMYKNGRIVFKAEYGFVTKRHLDRVLATFQAAHQKIMFQQSGVDLESQTAYELASRGLIRPNSNTLPLIYNLKTVDFDPPLFTIEVQCINEYEDYLLNLVHDIGSRLRTASLCTGLRCIKHGCFTVEHALLRKHWTVENIVNNITRCEQVLHDSGFKIEQTPLLSENISAVNK